MKAHYDIDNNIFEADNNKHLFQLEFFLKIGMLFCAFHFNLIEDGGFSVFQRFLKL